MYHIDALWKTSLASVGFPKHDTGLTGNSTSWELAKKADFPEASTLVPTCNKPGAPGWCLAGCAWSALSAKSAGSKRLCLRTSTQRCSVGRLISVRLTTCKTLRAVPLDLSMWLFLREVSMKQDPLWMWARPSHGPRVPE